MRLFQTYNTNIFIKQKPLKPNKMKRASQILIHKGMINSEQQLLPLKNKI